MWTNGGIQGSLIVLRRGGEPLPMLPLFGLGTLMNEG